MIQKVDCDTKMMQNSEKKDIELSAVLLVEFKTWQEK